jgi:acetyl-CoA carboxylase biotin carboxyl carrier protein
VALTEDDVREILQLIDESEAEELRVETSSFSLTVLRGGTAAPVTPSPEAPDSMLTIAAPIVGTFYRAPAPGAAPYVDVGSRIEIDTVVCLIEVMKMMNPVPAGISGMIAEICADNAELVEYGSPLFLVRADGT